MKLYIEFLKFLFNKLIKREETGVAIKKFAERMGVVYIKISQILATQNYGNLFTENDRKLLSSICDDCNKIPFDDIKEILENEYNMKLDDIFESIDKNPVGSASISQVHKAILKNGDVVAVKVKRRDITNSIESELSRIKKLVHQFGKFVKFENYIAADQALELYLKWIYEETDFVHEKKNIQLYQEFCDSVNHKVDGIKEARVPKVYDDLCTENVLVMEYIDSDTINKISLENENNKKVIQTAINSYIKASFHALLNDQRIVFHGDPHSGNIFIDKNGNIGFLDMGLLFVLSEEDTKLTRQFFLAAYTGNYENLYNLLIPYGQMDDQNKVLFKEEIKKYCAGLATKDVTYYFTDMINICLKYQFCPPDFIICMAKVFVCLNGINGFTDNLMTSKELLQEQTVEYFIRRSLKDCEGVVVDTIKFAPTLLESTLKYGLVKGIAKEYSNIEKLHNNMKSALENYKEILNIVKPVEEKMKDENVKDKVYYNEKIN